MTIYIVLVLMIIILLFLIYHKKKDIENFTSNNDSSDYLFPTRDLQEICKKEYNLFPAYGATQCMENGKPNPYANCKCEDESGNCKICYEEIKKDSKNANTVYDASAKFD
mgnify:CR=1 FL=1